MCDAMRLVLRHWRSINSYENTRFTALPSAIRITGLFFSNKLDGTTT